MNETEDLAKFQITLKSADERIQDIEQLHKVVYDAKNYTTRQLYSKLAKTIKNGHTGILVSIGYYSKFEGRDSDLTCIKLYNGKWLCDCHISRIYFLIGKACITPKDMKESFMSSKDAYSYLKDFIDAHGCKTLTFAY